MMKTTRPFWIRTLVLLCLLALFAQLTAVIPHLSVTYDEPIYTAIGYADLTVGDSYWHRVIGHGPLVNMLAAWPLLLRSDRIDVTQFDTWGSDDSLGFGREVLAALGPLKATLFATRYPITWLALILAAVVFRWARDAWGSRVGLVALVLFTFEPNLIAHGQLNTTDMGVTAFGLIGAYLLACYLRRPGTLTYLGAGLALGAAVASKTSGLFWVGAYGLIVFVVGLRSVRWVDPHAITSMLRWGLRILGLLAVALLALWACYGFEVGSLAPGGLPVPAPSHWAGLVYQRANLTKGQRTFIAGARYAGGHWLYFPLTLLLKTPLPLLIGVLFGLVLVLRRGLGPERQAASLLLPPVTYFGLSMLANLNIGHRHLLPVLPFLILIAAQSVRSILETRWRWAVGVLIVWMMIGTAGIFPQYLAYFNELAGGPDGGYRYLADSSIDWGQGFYALNAYLDARGEAGAGGDPEIPVKLAAFSSIDPAWYGIAFEPLPPTTSAPVQLPSRFRPPPGRYVISVVPLQGIWTLDPDTYDWFQHREPNARVAHVFHVYEVTDTSAPLDRIVQCGTPLPPLDEGALEAGFGKGLGVMTVRSTFDCTHGWLYPDVGGRLVVPGAMRDNPWVEARVDGVPFVFSQGSHWSHPSLDIYRMPANPTASEPRSQEVSLAPATGTPAKILAEGTLIQSPVPTSGPLTFLGYDLDVSRAETVLATFWRVDEGAGRPLSLMAHLLDWEGALLAVADGLEVPVEAWQPGDVIVQRHRFESGRGYLKVGAYWLDTMERWAMGDRDADSGNSLFIPEIVE